MTSEAALGILVQRLPNSLKKLFPPIGWRLASPAPLIREPIRESRRSDTRQAAAAIGTRVFEHSLCYDPTLDVTGLSVTNDASFVVGDLPF